MDVERGTDFEACFDSGLTGLVNTVTLMLIDNDGGIFWPASTADIIESPAGSGVYCANRTAPIIVGQYTMVWSPDGSYDPAMVGVEDLRVLAAAPSFPPLTPIEPDGGAQVGPCSAWTSAESVSACCGVEVEDEAVYQLSADSSARLLFELSGRIFPGECERTVRPCGNRSCGFQVLSRGHIVDSYWNGSSWRWYGSGAGCGCDPLDRIKLSGYPVREIVEVKIDGDVLAGTEYRLDERRYVTRIGDGLYWPSCQDLHADDNESGTFSITYSYGQDPPSLGQSAAAQLACELYKPCASGSSGDCALPTGVTRQVRQGLTIELAAFTSWGFRDGHWQTGLSLVDAFLNAYNKAGLMRRPTFWSPSRHAQYAKVIG